MYIYYVYIGGKMARAIMVSEEVYTELTKLKNPGESYSKVIHKFIHPQKQKKSLMEFAGAWNFMDEKDIKDIERSVRKVRKGWRPIPKW